MTGRLDQTTQEKRELEEMKSKLERICDERAKIIKDDALREKELQRKYSVASQERDELLRAKKIYEKFLDVDGHGGNILSALEEYYQCLISTRGKLRGDRAKLALEAQLNREDSNLRRCADKIFYETLGHGNKEPSKEDMLLFLQVLLIKYKTLVGNKLMAEMKRRLEASEDTDPEVASIWERELEVMRRNVPPEEDALKCAIRLIDKIMDENFGVRGVESVTADVFREIICKHTIGPRTQLQSLPLWGRHKISDILEEEGIESGSYDEGGTASK